MPSVWPSMATREGALDVTTLYVWFSKKKKKKTKEKKKTQQQPLIGC